MNNPFARVSYLKRQGTVIRYTMILVLLLATFYVVTMSSDSSDESAREADKNSMTITEETTIEAPTEALLKSQENISTSNGASATADVQSSQTTTNYAAESPSVETTVSVNGENIKVDENASVRKVIKSDDQKTTVDISAESNSTSDHRSSLNISVRSTSNTRVDD